MGGVVFWLFLLGGLALAGWGAGRLAWNAGETEIERANTAARREYAARRLCDVDPEGRHQR